MTPTTDRRRPQGPVAVADPELWAAMLAERERQTWKIELIASENYASAAVLEAAGLVAHQQVRRGPAGQALLRRLRVRRRRGAPRRGARPGPLPGRRVRQRPAALGRPGQHGRLRRRARARRPHPGHEPRPRRPPDPRHPAQLQRARFEVHGYGVSEADARIDYDALERQAARGPAAAPGGRRQRLPAHHRLRAHGPHRPRRRRAAVRGHGPHRRARGGRAAPQPVPARRHRHHDHPQDAARAARRPHLRPRRAGQADRHAPSSRAPRAARSCTSSRPRRWRSGRPQLPEFRDDQRRTIENASDAGRRRSRSRAPRSSRAARTTTSCSST